ncbi:hypothetical protein L1887_61931 [Cichorium endivia]|nr:hypothetical protein L1887_61931 [Cichorium endivia]
MILPQVHLRKTLLRLLLPLNDKVQWNSRDVAGGEPPTLALSTPNFFKVQRRRHDPGQLRQERIATGRDELELPRLLAPDLPSNGSSLRDLDCTHSNYQTRLSPVLLFIVTTSPCQDWVICAPAAFLGCGSRFSGSLSGIEP